MAWAEGRQVGFRSGRQASNHNQEKPSPETGDKATAEYTPVCHFAGEFGGKFLFNGFGNGNPHYWVYV
jgi:hypothetical protein